MTTAQRWILCLPPDALRSVTRLRTVVGLEIAREPGGAAFWLRGPGEMNDALLALDTTLRGRITAAGTMVAPGNTVPTADVPDCLPWQPLTSFPPVSLPPIAAAGIPVEPVGVRLRPAAGGAPAGLLRCEFSAFYEWGIRAPEIRLQPLRFAVSSTGDALVAGQPLPAVPGQRFTVVDGVACPLGFAWTPQIPAAALRRAATARTGDLIAFLDPAAPPLRLPGELFVPANRANLRATEP